MNLLRKSQPFFFSALLILAACGEEEETTDVNNDETQEDTITVAETVEDTVMLYVWANPLSFAPFLDHTWVTTTSSVANCPPDTNYWYCWGVCHLTGQLNPKARLLGQQEALRSVAECITTANDSNSNVNTHGGITGFYAFRGVCHQVANRTLYATAVNGQAPLTVEGAHGYAISHFLYGTYGRGLSEEWAQRIADCGGVSADVQDAQLAQEWLKEAMGDNYTEEAYTAYTNAQAEVHAFMDELSAQVEAGEKTVLDFANAVNDKVTEVLHGQIAPAMTAEEYNALFGLLPDVPVVVIDTEIAARESE